MLPTRILFVVAILLISRGTFAAERHATPVSSIRVKDGFQVELLRSAQPEEGSWISMTFDDQGRIILGEDKSGLLRVTLGDGTESTSIERLAGTEILKHSRGVLYAHDSLYVCATNGKGIYRLKDQDADGTYEDIQLICPLIYQSRYGHGANQMKLGPDGMIYIAIGNDVQLPEQISPSSPYRNPQNDWLLPNPHDGDQDDRVGHIYQMDPEGKTVTALAGGLRNHVDMAFNADGEIFTWDADMEWDVGTPWYRPTRINHVVSAGEYGWRWGTGKWQDWSPDNLPGTLYTGLGSPTGLVFGTASHWPERYRRALYAADWQNGRLLLVDFTEMGASYQAKSEVLAEGSPLNICDLVFGPDGALYFITGGRGSQSGLYRITITPEGISAAAKTKLPEPSPEAKSARKIRHQLEELHVRKDQTQLPFIWKSLASDDIWIRFAARVALENQPVAEWRSRVESEPDSKARHTALMALSRVGQLSDQAIILKGIQDWKLSKTDSDELLWLLRTAQLTLIRQGMPNENDRQALLDYLNQIPPSKRFAVNWMLSELLVALNSPQAVDRIVEKLNAAETQEEQIQYVKTLLKAHTGWTLKTRKVLLQWLIDHKQLIGGKLMKSTLQGMRIDFEESLSKDERNHFQQELALLKKPAKEGEDLVIHSNRPLVRKWTVDELDGKLAEINSRPHAFEKGRRLISEALCLRCHRFGDRGGQVGPDLSAVGKRMDRRTLLQSIIEPSKQIDPKYSSFIYLMEDGQVVSGRTTLVNRNQFGVETDQLTGKSVMISRDKIVESKVSPISPMPKGLLDTFTVEEIHELIAFLRRVDDSTK